MYSERAMAAATSYWDTTVPAGIIFSIIIGAGLSFTRVR